jgi:hypothetical protein
VTALLIVGVLMLTFTVIDPLFLDIVSQQIDKINALRAQTTYANMRDFINSGLLQGALVVLPWPDPPPLGLPSASPQPLAPLART